MRSLINRVALFFVLLDNLFFPIDIGVDLRVNYVVMILFIVYYLLTNRKIKITKRETVCFIFGIALLSLITVSFSISYVLAVKQLILLSITFIFSSFLINSYNFDIKKLFSDYVFFISVSSFLVLVQLIGSKLNLSYLVDFSFLGLDTGGIKLNAEKGRFHSWFYEPSFMAFAFIPVIFVCIARLFGLNNLLTVRRSLFLLGIFFMVKSSVGLLGLLISAVIIIFSKYPIYKRPTVLFFLTTSIIVGSYFIYQIPAVKFRVNETYFLFFKKNVTPNDIAKINMSTYALFSNYKITQASFSESPIFGTGLGTYELNYDKYLYQKIPSSNWRNNFKVNRQDGNSLFFRILVELGVIGIILFSFLIVKNRVKYKEIGNKNFLNLWSINNGIFVLILMRLLRQGHYTMLGFILFILIYYITNKQTLSVQEI